MTSESELEKAIETLNEDFAKLSVPIAWKNVHTGAIISVLIILKARESQEKAERAELSHDVWDAIMDIEQVLDKTSGLTERSILIRAQSNLQNVKGRLEEADSGEKE
jgi:hypothetical protein